MSGRRRLTDEERKKNLEMLALLQEEYQARLELELSNSSSLIPPSGENSFPGVVRVPDQPTYPVPLIISTDIGSDVDDALAFLQCLHLPLEHVDVLGLITEFGWVGVRMGVAKRVLEEYNAEHPDRQRHFPCLAGDNDPIFTIDGFMWHTGYEGLGCLESRRLALLRDHPFYENPREAAVDLIVETVREREPKTVTILCIGSLLNVAKAFRKDPELPRLINRIVFMGLGVVQHSTPPPEAFQLGRDYHYDHTNHNCRQDMGGAMEVFASDVPIVCIGHTVTHQFWYENQTTEHVRKCFADQEGPREVRMTGALLEVWFRHRSSIFGHDVKGTCPHDCLTLTEAVYPNAFIKYARGVLVVSPKDETSFVFNPEGRHFVAVGVSGDWDSTTSNDFVCFLGMCLSHTVEAPEVDDFLAEVRENERANQDGEDETS